jgi:2-C-methyl-D-erythritol 4-phosphate cytidylyltransferase
VSVAAVLLAGGSGRRMGRDVNKVYLSVAGQVLLDRPLSVLDAAAEVERLVLVVRPDDRPLAAAAVERVVRRVPVSVVDGGDTRTASERAALAVLETIDPAERPALTLLHDAARPFLTHDLLGRLIAAARDGGAIPGTAVVDPVVLVGSDGLAAAADDAGRLVRVQTPQVFRTDALLDAFAALGPGADSVDTAHVLEQHGDVDVRVVRTDERNLKVTTPDDLDRAESLAARWADGRWLEGS